MEGPSLLHRPFPQVDPSPRRQQSLLDPPLSPPELHPDLRLDASAAGGRLVQPFYVVGGRF